MRNISSLRRRTIAYAVAFVMIFGLFAPVSVLAADTEGGNPASGAGTVLDLLPLDADVALQVVPFGTDEQELNLPDALSALVEIAADDEADGAFTLLAQLAGSADVLSVEGDNTESSSGSSESEGSNSEPSNQEPSNQDPSNQEPSNQEPNNEANNEANDEANDEGDDSDSSVDENTNDENYVANEEDGDEALDEDAKENEGYGEGSEDGSDEENNAGEYSPAMPSPGLSNPSVQPESVDVPVTWTAQPAFDGFVTGEYVFTAVLGAGFVLADGVAMPTITVVVEAEEGVEPNLVILGFEGLYDFGALPYDYTDADIAPLEFTIVNMGDAPAIDVVVEIYGANFELFGLLEPITLDPGQEIGFVIEPALYAEIGFHTAEVIVDSENAGTFISIVAFTVNPPVNWATTPAYEFDFTQFPVEVLAQPGMNLLLRDIPVSSIPGTVVTIAPGAFAPNLNFSGTVGLPNQGFTPGGPVGNLGNSFLNPGGTRSLVANGNLRGPIRVEVDMFSNNGTLTQIPVHFGGQTIVLSTSGNGTLNYTTEVAYFGSQEEAILSLYPIANQSRIRAIRIFEGEFYGSWITVPTGTELEFFPWPYGYVASNLEAGEFTLTNQGSVAANLTYTVDPAFVVEGIPATLAPRTSVNVAVRPALGLTPGLYEYDLVITAAGANYVTIPLSFYVFPAPVFPAGVQLFYDGAGISLPNQFPNVNENIVWENDFRRVVFTEGSHMIRVNGQYRDADTSLAIPFTQNEVLWVPLESARLALQGATFTVVGDVLTVRATGGEYVGTALVATQALQGGNATFVPLQSIARAVGVGNIAWIPSRPAIGGAAPRTAQPGLLMSTTGVGAAQIRPENILYPPAGHEEDEAQGQHMLNQPYAWYGSQNALQIATSIVYMQRANGGWPRGHGQINVAWSQRDIGGMTPAQVQTVFNGRATNANTPYPGRGITTHDTRFMLMMYEVTGIERFLEAGLHGLEALFSIQDPVQGGFRYQMSGGSYQRALALSDNAASWILGLLIDIENGKFNDTLDDEMLARVRASHQLGLNFILSTQVRSSGFPDGVERLTAWATAVYQSDIPTPPAAISGHAHLVLGTPGEPAWMREFEPPGITNNESVGIVQALMGIEDPCNDVKNAISSAIYYFEHVALRGYRLNVEQNWHPLLQRWLEPHANATPVWSRFTCIDTLGPLFSDRFNPTGTPHLGVSQVADFEAAHGGPWQRTQYQHISQNATNANGANARGGTLVNLYRMPDNSLQPRVRCEENPHILLVPEGGVIDFVASYHNLTHERRLGFHYARHWPHELIEVDYPAWRLRVGLDTLPQPPVRPPSGGGGNWRPSTPAPRPRPMAVAAAAATAAAAEAAVEATPDYEANEYEFNLMQEAEAGAIIDGALEEFRYRLENLEEGEGIQELVVAIALEGDYEGITLNSRYLLDLMEYGGTIQITSDILTLTLTSRDMMMWRLTEDCEVTIVIIPSEFGLDDLLALELVDLVYPIISLFEVIVRVNGEPLGTNEGYFTDFSAEVTIDLTDLDLHPELLEYLLGIGFHLINVESEEDADAEPIVRLITNVYEGEVSEDAETFTFEVNRPGLFGVIVMRHEELDEEEDFIE